jgi:polyhydroxyalkanoate synthase subunit PhaC
MFPLTPPVEVWEKTLAWQTDLLGEFWINLARLAKLWELWMNPPELPLGRTPKEVVCRENKASLYNYYPGIPPKKSIPVLVVYALINRFYVLDLYPGRSFVEFLAGGGLKVYGVDWGAPGDEDRDLSLDDYVETYLDHMVTRVMEASGSPQVSLFGYCIGGTLSAIYAALHPERVKNLVLLTTPINFEKGGYLQRVVDKNHFPLDMLVDTFGNIPPWFIEAGFKFLNPTADTLKFYNFMKHLLDDNFVKNFLAIETWINDNVAFPGAAYRQFIGDLYQENKLYKGQLEMRGRRVDLKRITANHLSIAGGEDTIVPPESAICIQNLISSRDNHALVLPGGHVGVIIGGRALKTTWPRIGDWLLAHSG